MPRSEASQLLERIRAGEDLTSLLNDPGITGNSRPGNFLITSNVGSDDQVPSPDFVPAQRSQVETCLNMDLPLNIAALEIGIDRFFLCLGPLFPITTTETAQNLLQEFVEPLKHGDHGRSLKDRDNSERIRKCAAFSELYGMAAVGLQYNQSNLPILGRINQNTNVDEEATDYSEAMYQHSKHFLDEAIENDPLRAARNCALLTLWNIINHSTVALAYCGM